MEDYGVVIINGDARSVPLKTETVQCVITSPPYWGLRDYGVGGQLGLEGTPEEYVSNMVEVFREVRRVLKKDGVVWLNLGDNYAANRSYQVTDNKHISVGNERPSFVPNGLKPKDLVGIPWRVAFALQADGWWLRSDIIWAKPNPMPESVTDRPTSAHEYVFLLTKSAKYLYDADAVKEVSTGDRTAGAWDGNRDVGLPGGRTRFGKPNLGGSIDGFRNIRSVWTIPTQPFPEAHFAVFPEKLIETCIKAGSRPDDVVFDPFGGGSGRVHKVAFRLGRRAVTAELSEDYCRMAMGQREANHPLFIGV